MSGFLGGLAQGLTAGMQRSAQRKQQAAQQAIQQQQMQIQEQRLGMEKQRLGLDMRKQQREEAAEDRKLRIEVGMRAAAEKGGYSGVVDYLKTEDPEAALKIEKARADLDNSLLQQVDTRTTTDKKRQEILESGYTIMGNFSRVLNKVPENEKAAFYKNILPTLQQFVPNMPAEYNDKAKAMLDISLGLAIPASKAFDAEQQAKQMQTEVGKTYADMDRAIASGNTAAANRLQQQADLLMQEATQKNIKAAEERMKSKEGSEDTLRKEFIQITKDFQKVQSAYDRIQASASDPSAAGDLALIFNYMKMLDPDSVVRESEFATAANAAGIPERIRALYNRTVKGTRLSPSMRKDFVDRSDKLFESQNKSHLLYRAEYGRIASDRGLDPNSVLPKVSTRDSAEAIDYIKRFMKLNASAGATEADALKQFRANQLKKHEMALEAMKQEKLRQQQAAQQAQQGGQ